MVPVGCVPPHSSLHSTEGGCTSQFRSLVKISSLARSSWFHSSSSFSCPFQLSLSCSLVLKAAEEEQPLVKTRHIYHLCFSHDQDKTPFKCCSGLKRQVSFPKLMYICLTGGWRMLEAQGHIYGPRQATKELPGAPHNQDQHSASFRLLSVLHPLHRNSAGFPMGPYPYQHPKGSQKGLPNYLVWILPPLRDPMLLLEPAHTPLEKDKLHTVAGA